MPYQPKITSPESLEALDPQQLADWRASARLKAIRALRKAIVESGVSQRDIASKLNLNEAQISRLLRGDRNFTIDSLSDVARAIEHRLDVDFKKIPASPVRNYHISYMVKDLPTDPDEGSSVEWTETKSVDASRINSKSLEFA